MFYKYLSDKEVEFLKENDYDDELLKTVTDDDEETVRWIQENIGYFISYKDLFSTWLSMGKDFDVSNVRDALSAFSRLISVTHKKVFDKVFDTLQTGLSKLIRRQLGNTDEGYQWITHFNKRYSDGWKAGI